MIDNPINLRDLMTFIIEGLKVGRQVFFPREISFKNKKGQNIKVACSELKDVFENHKDVIDEIMIADALEEIFKEKIDKRNGKSGT